jgi:hypothetical protein
VVEDLLTLDKRLVEEEGVCVCLVFGKTLIREFAIVGWGVVSTSNERMSFGAVAWRRCWAHGPSRGWRRVALIITNCRNSVSTMRLAHTAAGHSRPRRRRRAAGERMFSVSLSLSLSHSKGEKREEDMTLMVLWVPAATT